MIDGTLIVLFLALGITAFGRWRYQRGWHEGRAALLRQEEEPLAPPLPLRTFTVRARIRNETEALRLHFHEHGFGPEYTDDATHAVMDEAHRTLFPECIEGRA